MVIIEAGTFPEETECRNCKKTINIPAAVKMSQNDWS